MPEELNTVTLGENEVRLERIKLPNGNTYILGCSFEEAQKIYRVLSGNIESVDERLDGLDDRVGDLEDFADDAEKTEKVISTSLNDLNQRIVSLTQENASLRSDITALQQEIAAIKRTYMSYYDVNASAGIGEQNEYSTT